MFAAQYVGLSLFFAEGRAPYFIDKNILFQHQKILFVCLSVINALN